MTPTDPAAPPGPPEAAAAPTAAPAAAGPLVRCPSCGGPSRFHPSNPWRPFCSDRCKGLDLGSWASEDYRVPAAPPTDPDLGGLD